MSKKQEPRQAKVGLIGEKGSGKSNLFMDLPFVVKSGYHGYPMAMGLDIEALRDTQKVARPYRNRDPDASTKNVVYGKYNLKFLPPTSEGGIFNPGKSDRDMIEIELSDGPGETQFASSNGARDAVKQQKDEQDSWLSNAEGLLITLPTFRLNEEKYLSDLLDYLLEIHEKPLKDLKRVVVVITMFDLLMFRFRDRALEFAAIPSFVLAVLREAIDDFLLEELDYFNKQHLGQDVDIRFIATSSWGFHPKYGCTNLDPNGVKPDGTEFGQRLVDLNRAERDPQKAPRFPYMAADPVVFAATGYANSFFFSREQLMKSSGQ